MFQNEYIMDINRYRHWTSPILTKAKGFRFWLLLTLVGLPTICVLYAIGARQSFKTTALLITLVAFYRGFLFRSMYANKQFRLLSAQFKKKTWMTKIVISDTIQLYMDGKLNNEVQWSQVDKLVEAKSYFDLEVDGDYLRLDKAKFTQGDAESFLTYMKEQHPEIPYQEEKPEFNR